MIDNCCTVESHMNDCFLCLLQDNIVLRSHLVCAVPKWWKKIRSIVFIGLNQRIMTVSNAFAGSVRAYQVPRRSLTGLSRILAYNEDTLALQPHSIINSYFSPLCLFMLFFHCSFSSLPLLSQCFLKTETNTSPLLQTPHGM